MSLKIIDILHKCSHILIKDDLLTDINNIQSSLSIGLSQEVLNCIRRKNDMIRDIRNCLTCSVVEEAINTKCSGSIKYLSKKAEIYELNNNLIQKILETTIN